MNHQLLLSLVRDKFGAQLLGVGVDVLIELGKDGDPDVFGANGEVQVSVVGVDGGIDETIRTADDEVIGQKRGLN